MMQQYRSIKARHRDAILFFRLGDFYEMFEQDAAEASRLLDLTLTQRGGVPMCGIPYHAAQGYVARLIKAGKKIAICEQTLIPKSGLASREVTEIITPGTVTDEGLLDRRSNNYLVGIGKIGEAVALSYLDLSTADFYATHFPAAQSHERYKRELLSLDPREVLVQESLLEEDEGLKKLLSEHEGLLINRYPDWSFDLETNRERLHRRFGVSSLKGLGLQDSSPEIAATGVILAYLEETCRGLLPHVGRLKVYADRSFVGLDESTMRNLEIVQNLNDRSRRYTLLEVLDQTRSAMGSRTLRSWLLKPLKEVEAIRARQEVVEFFHRNQVLLSRVREQMGRLFDLQRLASRVALEKAHAKDLLALKSSLLTVRGLTDLLSPFPELVARLASVRERMPGLAELAELLERSILEEPSIQLNEGNLIKPGFDPELDRLRDLKESSRRLLRSYLEKERQSSGIGNLKLRYNRVIGHFLEVTKSNLSLVPPHFIRRQTLVHGERFTTETLSSLESDINNASEKVVELEREHFLRVRGRAREQVGPIMAVAEVFAELDVLQAFAFAATLHAYVRPEVQAEPILAISEGRHPVVEANLPGGSFVPNSLRLDREGNRFVLLTGPNMAGKSTFLRQNALIVLMAQIGCFVPAASATVGVVDNIFCRVGATDNLARGESTFLVEMSETANILRSASQGSLIIMDEVGRGTGTKDGLSIAWAVTEYILERVGAFTLFATHFHELTSLRYAGLVNLSMAVLEREGDIVFLKQVREGPTDHSYGLHVARLAGVPAEVVRRAEQILPGLREQDAAGAAPPAQQAPAGGARQPLLFNPLDVIQDEIRSLDLDRLTPLEALNRIAAWKRELLERSGP
jgi:DNA mismatch repair protein MutS